MRTPSGNTARIALAIILTALVIAPICGLAQKPRISAPLPSSPTDTNAEDGLHRISIDVDVTDKAGHAVSGLKATDFSLLDNKRPVQILNFAEIKPSETNPDPVHVVIVVDEINTGFDVVAREREQLGEFFRQNGGRLAHPVTLAVLTESGLRMGQTPTADGNALFSALTSAKSALRLEGRGAGFWGVADRLQWSIEQLTQIAEHEATLPGRKYVFFLSPGWPMLAWSSFDSTEKELQWIFKAVETFTNNLRADHVVLYSLDPYELGRSNPFFYQSYLKPLKDRNQAQYPNISLQVLAAHSGGLVEVTGMDPLGELNAAMGDTGVYYSLTFEAPAPDKRDEYHEIKAQIDKPDVTVRTTAGYYANAQ